MLTEVVIGRVNMFLQHFRAPTTLGTKLQMSLEALQLEAGYRDCPFHHPYKSHGPLTTHCWCRLLWESLDHYGFRITLDYPEIALPHAGDQLLIDIFDASDLTVRRRRSL